MNLISDYRKKNKIKATTLADELGWGKSRLSNYETGSRGVCINDAQLIVSALNNLGVNCTLNDVFPPQDKAA